MKKFALCSALLVVLSAPGWADDTPAPAETPPPTTTTSPAEEPAKPEAPAATEKAKAPLTALDPAAQADPDVAARMETAYPLDGEEWREYPLGILEMEMQEVIEDLSSGKPKPPALVTQPRIISRLDVMITELEKKTGGGAGSNSTGNKPAEKSTLRKGKMKEGEMRAVKNEGDRKNDIPDKEREKILQSKNDGFPAGYEDVLADYFRKLSKAEKPAAAPAKDVGAPPAPGATKAPDGSK